MDERGISGHGSGQDESAAWLGDYAHDAWTEDKDDLDHEAAAVGDDTGSGNHAEPERADPIPEDSHQDPPEDPPGQPPEDPPADSHGDPPADPPAGPPADPPADPPGDWDEDPEGSSASSRWWLSPAFFAGAFVGMLAIALVWTLTAAGSDGGPQVPNAAAPDHRSAGATAVPASSTSLAQRREEHCASTAVALYGALRAAAPALDQWEVHVGAMNKLVVGAITLQQANQFWNQTRVGAQERLARFRAAERRLTGRTSPCPSPDELGHAHPALRSCAQVVARDRETLTAARKAIHTWAHHVQDMEMLRMGHMSPAMATHMWLASWKQGVRELEAYRSAMRAQSRQRCPA